MEARQPDRAPALDERGGPWRSARRLCCGRRGGEVQDGNPRHADVPPDVREALLAWRKASPSTTPDNYLLSYRDPWGLVDPKRSLSRRTAWELFRPFAETTASSASRPCASVTVSRLRPEGIRLSALAMAAWQGHKATEGKMRAVYDNP